MGRKVVHLKKATLIVAFFIFMVANAADTIETYKDVIEKAYNLSLQKDRSQAISLLVNAAKRESKKGTPPKELLNALQEVSTVFYSDKAQQFYELAVSLMLVDPALASVKLGEANRIEPDNILVQTQLARLNALQGDCSKSLEQGLKLKEQNPFSEELDLLVAQAAVCADKPKYFYESRPRDLKKSGFFPYWLLTQAELHFKKGEIDQLSSVISDLNKSKSNNPEVAYWQWKLETSRKLPGEKAGLKYIGSCKKMTARQVREYLIDPFLCRHTAEVENYLKKNNNAQ
jgi:hypothetical protein